MWGRVKDRRFKNASANISSGVFDDQKTHIVSWQEVCILELVAARHFKRGLVVMTKKKEREKTKTISLIDRREV